MLDERAYGQDKATSVEAGRGRKEENGQLSILSSRDVVIFTKKNPANLSSNVVYPHAYDIRVKIVSCICGLPILYG